MSCEFPREAPLRRDMVSTDSIQTQVDTKDHKEKTLQFALNRYHWQHYKSPSTVKGGDQYQRMKGGSADYHTEKRLYVCIAKITIRVCLWKSPSLKDICRNSSSLHMPHKDYYPYLDKSRGQEDEASPTPSIHIYVCSRYRQNVWQFCTVRA